MTIEPMGIFSLIVFGIIAGGVWYQLRKEGRINRNKQGNWSRQQMRSAKMNVDGSNQKPTTYVRAMANKLPTVRDENNRPISHYHSMMKAYYKGGSKGIQKYWNWAIAEGYDQRHGNGMNQIQPNG